MLWARARSRLNAQAPALLRTTGLMAPAPLRTTGFDRLEFRALFQWMKRTVMKAVNVAITGGAGQIGYALAFRVAAGAVFGPDTRVNLHLLEIPAALGGLQGLSLIHI